MLSKEKEKIYPDSYRLAVDTRERSKPIIVRVPCKIPPGWQGGNPEQLLASAQHVIQQSAGADPRFEAAEWILEHSSLLKNLGRKKKRSL